MKRGGVILLMLLYSLMSWALDDQRFETPEQQQRYQQLIGELRCLVCQNQNLADSNAPLAQDLRHKVAQMIRKGESDSAILDYLVSRYGDFVRYRPPFNPATWLLWLGPLLFLLLGGGMLWRVLHRQAAADKGDEL